jgi:hypothetical protein
VVPARRRCTARRVQFRQRLRFKARRRLALIQAQTITGAPQEVLISGLAPGFDYDVDVTSGVLTLVALNDGTPTTQETTQPLYLPLIQRSGW